MKSNPRKLNSIRRVFWALLRRPAPFVLTALAVSLFLLVGFVESESARGLSDSDDPNRIFVTDVAGSECSVYSRSVLDWANRDDDNTVKIHVYQPGGPTFQDSSGNGYIVLLLTCKGVKVDGFNGKFDYSGKTCTMIFDVTYDTWFRNKTSLYSGVVYDPADETNSLRCLSDMNPASYTGSDAGKRYVQDLYNNRFNGRQLKDVSGKTPHSPGGHSEVWLQGGQIILDANGGKWSDGSTEKTVDYSLNRDSTANTWISSGWTLTLPDSPEPPDDELKFAGWWDQKDYDRDTGEGGRRVSGGASAGGVSGDLNGAIPDRIYAHYALKPVAADPGAPSPCEAASEGWGWVACPIITALQGIVDWAMEGITDFLDYQSLNEGGDTIKNVHGAFIPIANIAFAIVFLIIIYSTAISGGRQ
ncbi:MAG: hypothetical protein FWD27_04570 [Coriobacteriia bacterium]|nr:hypothetical protein [Coriobacteriia bacterium]